MAEQKQYTSRQHIVPVMLLERFADERGVLWVYAKGKIARESVPEAECWEHEFYEFEVDGRATDNVAEDWLASIEGQATLVLNDMLEGRAVSQEKQLSWALFVASLFHRTRKPRLLTQTRSIPDQRRELLEGELVRDIQYDLFKQGVLKPAGEIRSDCLKALDKFEGNPSLLQVASLPHKTKSLASVLLEKKWLFVSAPEGEEFLVTDCPVSSVELEGRSGREGGGFGKPNSVAFLPVGRRRLFVASPTAANWSEVLTAKDVQTINAITLRFGHRNAYASMNSQKIQQLVDAELDKVRFGENAYLPSNSA